MDFFWVYDLPKWAFGLLTVATFVITSMFGMYFTRPLASRFIGKQSQNDMVSYYLAAVGVFYGITLGLIAVSTYTTYSEAGSTTSNEAAAVSALYRDVNNYPDPKRSELRNELKEYVRIVIEEVWPSQQRGGDIRFGTKQLERINTAMFDFVPKDEREQIIHSEALKQFNNLLTQNSLRAQIITSGLPQIIYMVLIIGALLNIIVTWLFVTDNIRLHQLLNALMAGLLGLLVFLIAVMDYPFRGHYSIPPDGLEFVRSNIMKD